MNLEDSYTYCLNITRNHYENFPVASLVIPPYYRKHIAAVYAFARQADDFADEIQDKDRLLDWRQQLKECTEYPSENPVFRALANTIHIFDLPVNWLDDLLTAFLLDLDKKRFTSFEELHEYSRYSANPVGRIVLWIFHLRSEKLMEYADYITTALQLTNFWQDISIDLKKDKIYIPLNLLQRYQIDEEEIILQKFSANFPGMVTVLFDYTYSLYKKGFPLLKSIQGRLRWELKFTIMGGMEILERVYQNKENLLFQRPVLNTWKWIKRGSRALVN
jgi:squalene synthase HpnC